MQRSPHFLFISFLPLVYAIEFNAKEYPFYIFLIIAPIGGFVGWLTNVLALKMTFFPVNFVGVPFVRFKNQPFGLFGWQGYVKYKNIIGLILYYLFFFLKFLEKIRI